MRTSCMYYTLTQQLQQLQPKFPNLFCTERIPASFPPPVSTPRVLSPPPPQLRLPAPVPARLPGPPSPRLTRPPTPRPPKPRPPRPPQPPPPLRKPASASPPSPPRPPKPRPRSPRPPLLPRTPPSTILPPSPPPPQTTSVTLLVTSGNEPDELLSCFTLDAYGMPYVIGILNDLLEVLDISKDLAIQVRIQACWAQASYASWVCKDLALQARIMQSTHGVPHSWGLPGCDPQSLTETLLVCIPLP